MGLAVVGMLGQVYRGADIVPRLDAPLRVMFVILTILLMLNTIRLFPRANTPAYRRLPFIHIRGTRRFTLNVGALNLLVCFYIVAVGSILAQTGRDVSGLPKGSAN